MFATAIVRTPCKNMINGLAGADLGRPEYEKALVQHQNYIKALESCNITVEVLAAAEDFPDSTFIEDIALCTPHCAIITNPGAHSRKDEIVGFEEVLKKYYSSIEYIKEPGTIEAGDIMMVGSHYYIGLSQRTNHDGAKKLIDILNYFGMSGSVINLKHVLHLKTGVAYLEDYTIAACDEFLMEEQFQKYDILEIPAEEAYAANCVRVNDKVLIPAGFPQTEQILQQAGFKVLPVDVSEFRKLDGGLSCLSLRF